MKANKPFGVIVEFRPDGTERVVAKLTVAEYDALERAMQWPEDLPAYDRLHGVTTELDMGISIFGGAVK